MSKLRVRKYAIEISSLRLVWAKYESCILHAESLSLVWMKYESYILHTSPVMYFSNLKTAVNDKAKGQTEEGVYTIERSYPKVGVSQILKRYLEYFSSYEHFPKLKRRTRTWV